MAPVRPSSQFREWLGEAITTSGLSKREIARRMAAGHPRGVTAETVETARRTINKILAGDLTPTQPTRDSIAAALDRGDAPALGDDDEEEDSLADTLQRIARQQAELAQLARRLDRQMRAQEVSA
jgi:transcriptional regulator with XRE-family HTH domain